MEVRQRVSRAWQRASACGDCSNGLSAYLAVFVEGWTCVERLAVYRPARGAATVPQGATTETGMRRMLCVSTATCLLSIQTCRASMVIPVLTTLVGLLGLWMARHVSRETRLTRNWQTTPGRILERGVGAPMGGPGRSYLPHVKYAYTVDGQEYINDQVYLIRGTGGLADSMQSLVDALPDPVPVHYNPAEPARSYLLDQPKSSFRIAAVTGTILLLAGLLQLLVIAAEG